MKPSSQPTLLSIIGHVTRPYRWRMVWVWVCTIIATLCASAYVYVLKYIVDTLVHSTPGDFLQFRALILLCGLYYLLDFSENGMYRLSAVIAMTFFPEVRTQTRVYFFRHLHRHSHRYFSNHFAGSLANKVTMAGRAIDEILSIFSWDILTMIVYLISTFVILTITDWRLSLAFGAMIAFLLIQFFLSFPTLRRNNQLFSDARSLSTGETVDTITNIWNITNNARSQSEEVRLEGQYNVESDVHRFIWRFAERFRFIYMTFLGNIVTGIMMIAIYLWYRGWITVGDFTVIFFASTTLLRIVRNSLKSMIALSEKIGDVQDAIDTIFVPHDVIETPDATVLRVDRGNILFDNISFAYISGKPVFSGMTLTIPAGQRVGFVGRSGSGKTTLGLLLQRFYDVTGGRICIDGHDIAHASLDSLRSSIAVVPQDPILFHRSLAENIAYGRKHASIDEIIEAARLAYAHDFIERIEEGYSAKVGERGIKLSGGQRQRIAVARAILKDAPILLLDEATSALDSESEHIIQQAFEHLMRGRTTIVIAHRLSTISHLDRIIVFDTGRIVEDGTHTELLANGGIYSSLWMRQAGGFIE